MNSSKLPPSGTWLSLREASARLGISPAALRAWADQGHVVSFRTPGGHRRFNLRDLEHLAGDVRNVPTQISLQLLAYAALGRARLALTDRELEGEAWYRALSSSAREEHQQLGRSVVWTLSQALTETEEELSAGKARELGRAYAAVNRRHHVAVGDALRALVFFRDRFVESVVQVTASMQDREALALVRRVYGFVDTMLVAMVDAPAGSPERSRRRKVEREEVAEKG